MVAAIENTPGPVSGGGPTFGSREELLADLAEATRSGVLPKVLVMFALDGFRDLDDTLGRVERQALLAGLVDRLERTVSSVGTCYQPRGDEFALLCPAGDALPEPLLHGAVAALSEHDQPVAVKAALASVVVPDEASDPIAALRLVDERLTAAHPGRPPRERRRHVRAGARRELAGNAGSSDAAASPLLAIHGELVEVSANALRIRRVDQLLDVAGTLTMLSDAVRIDDRDAGGLQGKPREPARIPLLLRELGLKLAALHALGGPRIREAIELVEQPAVLPTAMSAKVHKAFDEISAALAVA